MAFLRRVCPRAGVIVYGAGTYSAMVLFAGAESTHHSCAPGTPAVSEADRRQAYEVGASTYEKDVCAGEEWMGISSLRKALLGKAAGRVLEVGAGTGHNFPLYPPACSVTAIDCSENMVKMARGRMTPTVIAADVMEVEALQFAPETFDTIVDTFGLCRFDSGCALPRLLMLPMYWTVNRR